MFIKLVVSELQWGRIHMSSYEEMTQFLFDVFESAFLMKKHHSWRVVKNQSVGYSEGNFLHPTPGCPHNPTLC